MRFASKYHVVDPVGILPLFPDCEVNVRGIGSIGVFSWLNGVHLVCPIRPSSQPTAKTAVPSAPHTLVGTVAVDANIVCVVDIEDHSRRRRFPV